MKKLLTFFSFVLLVFACSSCKSQGRKNAKQIAKEIQSTVKQFSPGSIATTTGGYYMTAKIDGKNWVAVSMLPIKDVNRVIGYVDDGGYIGLGVSGDEKLDKKIDINASNAADLFILTDGEMLLDRTNGEIKITKRDGPWIEGTFHFTAGSSQSNKKIQVTNGFFRVR